MSSKIQGSLKIMSLPDVLQWISLAQKSGSLVFERHKEDVVCGIPLVPVPGRNEGGPIEWVCALRGPPPRVEHGQTRSLHCAGRRYSFLQTPFVQFPHPLPRHGVASTSA